MSSRFHVNSYQVFGNHELFPETEKFMLETCHAKVDGDGCFGDTEVTDLNGLVRAVALDTYDEMKPWATDDASVLLSKLFPKRLTGAIFERESHTFPDPRDRIKEVPLLFYWQMKWFLDDKRIATVYNLVNHLMARGDVVIGSKGELQVVLGKQILTRFG